MRCDAISCNYPVTTVMARSLSFLTRFVISKEDDLHWAVAEQGRIVTPDFPASAVRPLAPVEAGTVLCWYGNTIHWGSKSAPDGKRNCRNSSSSKCRRLCRETDHL